MSAEPTTREQQQLRECYTILHDLAANGTAPSVRAAARAAVAEVHVALDGQALEFEMYSHHWLEKGRG
jgi:hypothetical protein